jgi:hypothetical protein
MWVLIGLGANDLKIPALVFADRDSAQLKCIEIFGHAPDGIGRNGRYYWNIKDGDQETPLKMYTSYYDGCGGVYRAELREVIPGTPFVPFNLD